MAHLFLTREDDISKNLVLAILCYWAQSVDASKWEVTKMIPSFSFQACVCHRRYPAFCLLDNHEDINDDEDTSLYWCLFGKDYHTYSWLLFGLFWIKLQNYDLEDSVWGVLHFFVQTFTSAIQRPLQHKDPLGNIIITTNILWGEDLKLIDWDLDNNQRPTDNAALGVVEKREQMQTTDCLRNNMWHRILGLQRN